MKPPMCKLCNHAHYGVAHIFEAGFGIPKLKIERSTALLADVVKRSREAPVDEIIGAVKPRKLRKKPFDRNAYQRELMRKRRAAVKVKRK